MDTPDILFDGVNRAILSDSQDDRISLGGMLELGATSGGIASAQQSGLVQILPQWCLSRDLTHDEQQSIVDRVVFRFQGSPTTTDLWVLYKADAALVGRHLGAIIEAAPLGHIELLEQLAILLSRQLHDPRQDVRAAVLQLKDHPRLSALRDAAIRNDVGTDARSVYGLIMAGG